MTKTDENVDIQHQKYPGYKQENEIVKCNSKLRIRYYLSL